MHLKLDGVRSDISSRDKVYSILKASIMEFYLEPGSSINETDIAAALGVSRTPIREVFVRLSRENLVISYPQRGSFVTQIDMQLVEEGRFMRKCLEKAVYKNVAQGVAPEVIQALQKSIAIQKAIVNGQNEYTSEFLLLDNKFHQLIFEADQKGNIWRSILDINTHFNRLRFLEVKEQCNIQKVLFQHEMLVDALESHDVDTVNLIIEAHTGNVMKIVDSMQEKYPGYFLQS